MIDCLNFEVLFENHLIIIESSTFKDLKVFKGLSLNKSGRFSSGSS